MQFVRIWSIGHTYGKVGILQDVNETFAFVLVDNITAYPIKDIEYIDQRSILQALNK